MIHLLNLLAAIALLVWSTYLVRTGMLRVAGENLRGVLSRSFSNRLRALLAGLGVTSLVQSATATCLIVASFVGKGLVATSAALAVMLGADVGTALMVAVYSFDLSWVSPLLIFIGVVTFISRQNGNAGRVGRILIGLALTFVALDMIAHASAPIRDLAGLPSVAGFLQQDLVAGHFQDAPPWAVASSRMVVRSASQSLIRPVSSSRGTPAPPAPLARRTGWSRLASPSTTLETP